VWWSYLNWTETRDGGRHVARGEVQSLLKGQNAAPRPSPAVRPLPPSVPPRLFLMSLLSPERNTADTRRDWFFESGRSASLHARRPYGGMRSPRLMGLCEALAYSTALRATSSLQVKGQRVSLSLSETLGSLTPGCSTLATADTCRALAGAVVSTAGGVSGDEGRAYRRAHPAFHTHGLHEARSQYHGTMHAQPTHSKPTPGTPPQLTRQKVIPSCRRRAVHRCRWM
jgi:hypothetical protein